MWVLFFFLVLVLLPPHTVLASRVRVRVQYNTVLNLHCFRWSFYIPVLLLFDGGDAVYSTVLSIDLYLEREHPHERERVWFGERIRERAGDSNRFGRGVENDVANGNVDERVKGEGVVESSCSIVVESGAVNDRGIDNERGPVFAVGSDNETIESDRDFLRDEFGEVLVFERDTGERASSSRRFIGVDFEGVVNHIIDVFHNKIGHSFGVFVP